MNRIVRDRNKEKTQRETRGWVVGGGGGGV